jgi:hypothetical protein
MEKSTTSPVILDPADFNCDDDDVCIALRISRSTLKRLRRHPDPQRRFPLPIQFTPRGKCWWAPEAIRAYRQRLIELSQQEPEAPKLVVRRPAR